MEDSDQNELLEAPKEPASDRYAVTIKVQSWATPIVGLIMLVVGLLAGYFVRPVLPGVASTPTPVAVAQATTASPTQNPAAAQELMKYLVGQAKHFEGDANAPVTMIEFSDFQ